MLAFFVEAVDLSNLPALVVAADEGDFVRESVEITQVVSVGREKTGLGWLGRTWPSDTSIT